MKYYLTNLEETQAFSKKIASVLKKGDILCLEGDLGAGKTTFTQFLLENYQVDEYVTSPTFNIVNSYEGVLGDEKWTIHHFDVYRISHYEELLDIGYEEYADGQSLLVIEWPSRMMPLIPDTAIFLTLTIDENQVRVAQIKGLEDRGV